MKRIRRHIYYIEQIKKVDGVLKSVTSEDGSLICLNQALKRPLLYSGRGHAFRLLLSKQIMRSKANVAQQKPKEPTGKLKFCLSVKSLIGHCCIS